MKPDKTDKSKSTSYGVFAPLLGCAYGLFALYTRTRPKLSGRMTGEEALWYSMPVFGLALFFHARYFYWYRRYPWLRWGLMLLAILAMARGLLGVVAPMLRGSGLL